MTDLFTIDFETYYDKEYSLSRMSTEDYVMDDRFEIIMCGIKKNDGEVSILRCESEDELSDRLTELGVNRGAVICHNMIFDGLILARLGVRPKIYLDTLAMAQLVLKPFHRSISLAKCLENTKCPLEKGTYVTGMMGRRLASLTDSEFQKYAEYCATDVEGTYWLFNHLKASVPKDELHIIDLTLRMYLEPQFVLDREILENVYREEKKRKKKLMEALPKGIKKTQLTSNPQFAKLLESVGVEPPMKISPVTDKATFAFAKNDPEWKDLEERYGDDPVVGAILAARLGTKSTISETRALRFLEIADRHRKLRVPLRYYGAHTGRYSGMEKINCQNLPRIPPNPKNRFHLRYALKGKKGYSVLASDLSQIEARLNAWLSGCDDLIQVFRDGGDPYASFASKLYGREIVKGRDDEERFIGKTCILGLGYGMGAKKLRGTLRASGRNVDEETVKFYVDTYRSVYWQIPALWRRCDEIIKGMASGKAMEMIGPLLATKDRLTLPNGLAISYNNLRWVDSAKYEGWKFDFAERPKMLWGGTMVENICQSLARITITEHMLRVHRELGLKPALQAHDEIVYTVPTHQADMYKQAVLEIMQTPPSFAPDLPIDAEASWGETYGDAK